MRNQVELRSSFLTMVLVIPNNQVLLFLAAIILKLSTVQTNLQQGLFPVTDCGTTYTRGNGTLSTPSSPPSPTNYTSSLNCKWIIDTRNESTSRHLELRVLYFDVKGSMPYCMTGNYVEVFIGCGYTSVGRFCGVSVLPVFYSSDGCMGITLHSQSGDSNFSATYNLRPLDKAVQHIPSGCGLSQLDNTRQGNIFSPHWPLPYPDYVDCVWTVRARKDLEVKLIFFDFDVKFHQPCQLIDFIEVRAGSTGYVHAKTLTKDKECGQKKPFSMIINTDTFYITFRSDKGTGPRGFMAGFVAYEKGTPVFDPQVLIIFGCGLLLMILVAFKKFAIPALVKFRRSLIKNGTRNTFKFWLRRRSCDCGYECVCQEIVSMQKRMSLRRIEDSPYQETMVPPLIPKQCFVGQNECLECQNKESTLVSVHDVTEFLSSTSVTDLYCAFSSEPSPAPNLQPNSDDSERRASCKLVRFANPNILDHPPSSSHFDS